MIVCLCFGINQNALDQLKDQGCDSLRKIQKTCQAGSSCGACIPELKKSLQESTCHSHQDSDRNC